MAVIRGDRFIQAQTNNQITKEARVLIERLTEFRRGRGTLLTSARVRVDMQVTNRDGYRNLQAQLNTRRPSGVSTTIAAVLVDDGYNGPAVVGEVRSALVSSLHDGHWYTVRA